MTESIPELPALEISKGTQREGLNQSHVDTILEMIYAQVPGLFTRIAQREDDFPGQIVRDPNAGPNDAVVKEFQSCLSEFARQISDVDITQLGVWTQMFWEARRRARVMYGLPIVFPKLARK